MTGIGGGKKMFGVHVYESLVIIDKVGKKFALIFHLLNEFYKVLDMLISYNSSFYRSSNKSVS